MLTRRKSLAALAAVTASLAVAVPTATANAASPTVDPTVCQLLNFARGPFGTPIGIGGSSLGDVLNHAGASVGCAAPAAPSLPFTPWVQH